MIDVDALIETYKKHSCKQVVDLLLRHLYIISKCLDILPSSIKREIAQIKADELRVIMTAIKKEVVNHD